MRILLDTNAYTRLRLGAGIVVDRVRNAREVMMSTIVLGEVLYGFRHGPRAEANEDLLHEFLVMPRVTVLPATEATADRYSRICTLLRRKGTPIPTNDAWIAAHAMECGAELITFDGHFKSIDGLALRMLSLDDAES